MAVLTWVIVYSPSVASLNCSPNAMAGMTEVKNTYVAGAKMRKPARKPSTQSVLYEGQLLILFRKSVATPLPKEQQQLRRREDAVCVVIICVPFASWCTCVSETFALPATEVLLVCPLLLPGGVSSILTPKLSISTPFASTPLPFATSTFSLVGFDIATSRITAYAAAQLQYLSASIAS